MLTSPLTIVKPPEYNLTLERRYESRHEISGSALVRVVAAEDPNQVGRAFRAEVINVSADGICLSANELMDGCLLDVWIGVESYSINFYLGCEVIWASLEENGEFQMGVEILDKFNTDIVEWRRVQAR